MTYTIGYRGRTRTFKTLVAATACANTIFAATGIIVGIEKKGG